MKLLVHASAMENREVCMLIANALYLEVRSQSSSYVSFDNDLREATRAKSGYPTWLKDVTIWFARYISGIEQKIAKE